MNYTLNELIEEMKPQAEKDKNLMRECVKGLALYAGQRAQVDPMSPEIAEMRSLVQEIVGYWGLDDEDQERLQNDFMQPFDDTVAGALAGESLGSAITRQRAVTIHGLYRYGMEMVCAQGINCKDDILAMSALMRKLASVWDFESDSLYNLANELVSKVREMEIAHEPDQPDQGMSQSKPVSGLVVEIIRSPEETDLYYSSNERDAEMGCIGHLRADFGRSGNEFWHTWFDHCSELKTQAFKDELDTIIKSLREDGGMLKSLSSLSNYCYSHPDAKLDLKHRSDTYGFKVDTADHSYYIRGMLTRGDYNLYCYCYQRSTLEEYLATVPSEQPDQGMSQSM